MLSFVQLCFETIIVIEAVCFKNNLLAKSFQNSFQDKSFENNNFFFSFEELVSNKLAENMAHHMVDAKLACNPPLQLSGGMQLRIFQLRACMLSMLYLQDPASQ